MGTKNKIKEINELEIGEYFYLKDKLYKKMYNNSAVRIGCQETIHLKYNEKVLIFERD